MARASSSRVAASPWSRSSRFLGVNQSISPFGTVARVTKSIMALRLRILRFHPARNRLGAARWAIRPDLKMPLSHLLDTSVYCQPLKPQPLPSVVRRWSSQGDETFAISVLCEAELLYGLELKKSARLDAMYDELLKNRLPVLIVDGAVAKTFAVIKANCRKKGASGSDFDFMIAATAKTHGLILATLNVRHFRGIDGLAVEDWSA
jgi:predicted nucleic acid-binding protein